MSTSVVAPAMIAALLLAAPRMARAQATAVRVPHPGSAAGGATGGGAPLTGGQRAEQGIPPQYAPPTGMCRVWVRGVPPAQQPAPTECAKAVRVRAPNSRVVFGSSKPATARPVLPRPPITGNAILSPEHSSVYAPAHPVPAIPDRVRTAPATPMHPPQPMGPARVSPPAPQPHGRVAAPRVRMSVPKPPPRHGR